MGGETVGCAARKKNKNKNNEKHLKNENGDGHSKVIQQSKTTRGGLRVYKIVILGDGGVGKSGKRSLINKVRNQNKNKK